MLAYPTVAVEKRLCPDISVDGSVKLNSSSCQSGDVFPPRHPELTCQTGRFCDGAQVCVEPDSCR